MSAAPQTGAWPGFVVRVATHVPPAVIADELVDAWPVIVGGEIPGGALAACLAQLMEESGTRQINRDHDGDVDADDQADGCWNGNVGNLRGTYQGAWTSFRAGEGFGAHEVILEPGPDNRFRSYLTGPEAAELLALPSDSPRAKEIIRLAIRRGVRDFLSLLARKYPRALERASMLDYEGYVHELHVGGYFTASETAYAKAEEALRRTIEQLPQVVAFLERSPA